MFSKRSLENYLEIDHRESPGFTPKEAMAAGLPGLPLGRGMHFKSATIHCSHCTAEVILNPDRSRSRGYCPKCDKYLCDFCEAERVATGVCRPFQQVIDEFMEQVAKGIAHPVVKFRS